MPWERATSAAARSSSASQSGSASERGSSSSSSAIRYSRCQPVTFAGFRSMMPSRTACSITRTSIAMLFFTVDRLHSSAIQPCTARSTAPLVIIRPEVARVGTTRLRHPARYGSSVLRSSPRIARA